MITTASQARLINATPLFVSKSNGIKCEHPAKDRKQIILNVLDNTILHEYCQKCGLHKRRGEWISIIKSESNA